MELANRLSYFPLVRLVLFSAWTRIVLILLMLAVVGLALGIPRIWTASPAGFTPPVTVSLIDLIQAWNLRRHAEQHLAAGRIEESLHSWGAAVANNRANPQLVRGYLRALVMVERPAGRSRQALAQSDRLLRLTNNSQEDLELVAQLYGRCGLQSALLALLRPREANLSPALEAAYLKALFNSELYGQFQVRWEQLGNKVPTDPELGLYRAVYLANWGPAEQAGDARQTLSRAAAAGANVELANRLLLKVHSHGNDVGGCQVALNQLRNIRADLLADHAILWRLLVKADRTAEARQLVQAYVTEPTTLAEAVELAEVCALVGFRQRAKDLLSKSFDTYGFSSLSCVRYGTLLVEDKQWAEVRSLALKLRLHPGLRGSLLALANVIEAEAELGEGRREAAEATLRALPSYDYEDPQLGLGMASSLLRAGMAELALPLLTKLEGKLDQNPEFWAVCLEAGRAQTNSVIMFRALQRSYELQPNDPKVQNAYAGILLLQRVRPELALKLTSGLYATLSNSLPVRINHAAALLANGRPAEARGILVSVNLRQPSAADFCQYSLIYFDVCLALGLTEEAWRSYDRIDQDYLYPSQRQRLDAAIKTIPPRSIAAPTAP